MYLQEVFDQLTYGELSQLSIGGQPAGEINTMNFPQVLSHLNLGLTALYKRFHLKEGRLLLQLVTGTTSYEIKSAFAVNKAASRETVRYLLDTATVPFKDDILKIERVLTDDEDEPFELALNDASDRYSLFTPSATTLLVPADIVAQASDLPCHLETSTLLLIYRANHPKIVQGFGLFDPERIVVQLPDSHLEALVYFVASRVNNPVGMSNEFHAGNSYYAKFEQACQQLEGQNLQVDRGSQNTRLQRGGWV